MHPLVVGELATGNLRDRAQTLSDLRTLPAAGEANFDECLHFLESRKLYGKGLGWIDTSSSPQPSSAAFASGPPTKDSMMLRGIWALLLKRRSGGNLL